MAAGAGASHFAADFRFRRASGDWACVASTALILRENDAAVRLVGLMIDATERIQMEQRAATAMTHDFKNVLMIVSQAGELIARFYPDDPRLVLISDRLFTAVSRSKEILSTRRL